MKRWLVVAALALASAASAQTDEEIALRFTPKDVLDDIREADTDVVHPSVAVQRLTPDLLAAAYAGVHSGALRIIELKPSPAVIADTDDPMGGHVVHLELEDLDGDRAPELVVTYTWDQGPQSTRIFKWSNRRLVPLVARDDIINDPFFIDLDGDGVREAIGSLTRGSTTMPLYKLTNGRFVRSGSVLQHAFVIAGSNAGEDQFDVETPGEYVLQVTREARDKLLRATAGEVRLNGKVIIDAGDLASSARYIRRKVHLNATNTLTARVDAPAKGAMTVTISDVAEGR